MRGIRRIAGLAGLAMLGVLVGAPTLAAQATGRVTGIVTDSTTGSLATIRP